jgi:hypothetical protein
LGSPLLVRSFLKLSLPFGIRTPLTMANQSNSSGCTAIVVLTGLALLVGGAFEAQKIEEKAKPKGATLYDHLQDPGYRESFAEVAMKQTGYLRDPDSLVVESTSPCSRHTFDGTDWIVFAAHYRAKNGFGGYNQNMAWVLCSDAGKFRIMTDSQYDELGDKSLVTPASAAKHHAKSK